MTQGTLSAQPNTLQCTKAGLDENNNLIAFTVKVLDAGRSCISKRFPAGAVRFSVRAPENLSAYQCYYCVLSARARISNI